MKPKPKIPRWFELPMAIICEECNVDLRDMRSRSRERRFVYARMIAYKLAHELSPHLIFNRDIGQWFGRDESTVCCALKALSDLLSTDEQFAARFQKMRRRLQLTQGMVVRKESGFRVNWTPDGRLISWNKEAARNGEAV